MDPGQPPPLPPYAEPPHGAYPPALPAGYSAPAGYPAPPVPGPYYVPPFAPLPYAGPPRPPRVWTAFVAYIVAFVGGFGAASVVAASLAIAIHGIEVFDRTSDAGADVEALMMEPEILLPTVLVMQIGLVAVAISGAALSPVPWRRRLRLVKPRLPWYGYPILLVGTYAFGWASGIVIELLDVGDEGALEQFAEAVTGLHGWMLVATALVIGLAPGFGEELLFRGYIQTRLVQRWPRLLAVGVTSVLFGVIHMDLVQGTFAVCMGLWLGEVADRTGSLWPAIVCHAFNNSMATVMGAVFGSEAEAVDPGAGYWIWLGILGAVFLLAMVYLLRRPVVPVEDGPIATPTPPPYPIANPV
jgi:membrane protease YdiL (CAAX protease family)